MDGVVLDLATGAWTPMSQSAPIGGRVSAAAVWTGSFAIVWGGQVTSHLRDGAIYVP